MWLTIKNLIMKKILLTIVIGASLNACTFLKSSKEPEKEATVEMENLPQEQKNTIYDFVVKDIDGNDFNLADLKGKKVMIVNTASECGFTPQYEDLEEIYNKYKDQNFTIIGFPANNFKGQEPGSNEEIKQFCTSKFNVTFPMMSKISVKGEDQAPLYQFLTEKSKNGVLDSEVEWNFQKYLINEDGTLAKVYYSKVKPTDSQITNWIEGL